MGLIMTSISEGVCEDSMRWSSKQCSAQNMDQILCVSCFWTPDTLQLFLLPSLLPVCGFLLPSPLPLPSPPPLPLPPPPLRLPLSLRQHGLHKQMSNKSESLKLFHIFRGRTTLQYSPVCPQSWSHIVFIFLKHFLTFNTSHCKP